MAVEDQADINLGPTHSQLVATCSLKDLLPAIWQLALNQAGAPPWTLVPRTQKQGPVLVMET